MKFIWFECCYFLFFCSANAFCLWGCLQPLFFQSGEWQVCESRTLMITTWHFLPLQNEEKRWEKIYIIIPPVFLWDKKFSPFFSLVQFLLRVIEIEIWVLEEWNFLPSVYNSRHFRVRDVFELKWAGWQKWIANSMFFLLNNLNGIRGNWSILIEYRAVRRDFRTLKA